MVHKVIRLSTFHLFIFNIRFYHKSIHTILYYDDDDDDDDHHHHHDYCFCRDILSSW